MRQLFAGFVLLLCAGTAQAQTTISGPITFGSALSVSGAGTVSIASGGVGNAMLANPSLTLGSTALTLGGTVTGVSGLTLSGTALSGATTLPNGIVTSAGLVGIGTASPAAALDVQTTWPSSSPANLSGSWTSYGDPSRFVIRGANGTRLAPTAILAGQSVGNINFRGYTSAGAFTVGLVNIQPIAEEDYTGTSDATGLAFGTTPTGTTQWTAHMYISGAGYVGVGTQAPNYLMQLHDAAGTGALLQFTNATTGSGAGNGAYVGFLAGGTDLWIDNQTSGAVKILAGGVEQLRVDSGGGFYLDHLPTTPGGKQPLCVDTSSKQVYDGSAGAC